MNRYSVSVVVSPGEGDPMSFALQFRSAVLLAASAAASPAFSQAYPPGAIPGTAMPTEIISAPGIATDPFMGGAYAVPTGAPISVAYGDPAAASGIVSGPVVSGPTPSGGPVYMAPQVIGSPMPGSPGCNCGPGGASGFDPSMMGGMPVGQSYQMPMGAPAYGGMPYGDPSCGMPSTGCCLTDGCCLFDGCLGGLGSPCLDPCGTACPPVCDPCQPICDPCQQPGVMPQGGLYHGAGGAQRCGWSAGYSFVFLRPYYGSNEAFLVQQNTGPGSFTTTTEEFDYSLDLSSRVFVEYVGQRDVGIRATWFGFQTDSNSVSEVVGANTIAATPLNELAFPGDTIAAESAIDLDTIDLDVTRRIRIRRSMVNLGGGFRWASYDHDYVSGVSGPFGSNGSASRRFNGFGPTLFAELRRPIGSSQFSFLANLRGSMLYGEGESESVVTAQTPFGAVTSVTRNESDDFVATAESQLGVEWSAWVNQRSVLFVQTALETQYWLGIGTPLDRNDDLGLFGFSTTVGLEW